MSQEDIICENCGENLTPEIFECNVCCNQICDTCANICKKCGGNLCDGCYHDHKKNC